MSAAILLTYNCPPELKKWADKAAHVWNGVLVDLIKLEPTIASKPNIAIVFSTQVRTSENPTRVAQCRRVSTDRWSVELDGSSQTKWGLSNWQRFWGIGEDVLAALIHEMGHVFNIRHSNIASDVMHPEIGGTGKLTKDEKTSYREQVIESLKDDADFE